MTPHPPPPRRGETRLVCEQGEKLKETTSKILGGGIFNNIVCLPSYLIKLDISNIYSTSCYIDTFYTTTGNVEMTIIISYHVLNKSSLKRGCSGKERLRKLLLLCAMVV